jgi:hypothetical protein
LRETIAEARRTVEGQPGKWDVLTGHTFGSRLAPIDPPQPVYQRVDKATFLALLDRFHALIDESVRTGRRIVCLGD